ncbi:Spy/CpxP family protein refolding chaperone [Granulicella tundricola]|uniref:Periplasmic heavy metal sensor n=1 Tax=Granulicella tundricola (strain ATCC BAA-1859 / DSM 23138 / MP5ACTX9) TaxID=1198114 RepID=E8X6I2_GRATM|nr:Spy/CpxP family protein refolding chaperone [Granulicella tundricola]ADW71066.1 hypothetical protein AciX9_4298 [Granulicella tundricola MP5ACTX9]
MKNLRLTLITAASLAVLATSAFAFSQSESSRGSQPRMIRRVIARFESRLNITTAQREQVKAILKTEEPTILALAAQAKQEREAMTALPTYNEAQVREVAQQYAATNTNILVERTKVRLELRAVLTPQQLQQLEQFKSTFGAGSGDRVGDRLDMVLNQL